MDQGQGQGQGQGEGQGQGQGEGYCLTVQSIGRLERSPGYL